MSDSEVPILESVISFEGDDDSEDIVMLFKDGEHNIPGAIVAHLGGTNAVKGMKNLDKVTFQSWSRAFWGKVEQAGLNAVQQNMVNSHLLAYPKGRAR